MDPVRFVEISGHQKCMQLNFWRPEIVQAKFLVTRNAPHMFMPANGNLLRTLINYVALIWVPNVSLSISGDQKYVLNHFWWPEMQFGIFLATIISRCMFGGAFLGTRNRSEHIHMGLLFFQKKQILTLDTYSLGDQCPGGGGTSAGEPWPLTCKRLSKNPSRQP